MISKTIEAALNEQIKHEIYSSYLYLSMSAWAEASNFAGAAHWLRIPVSYTHLTLPTNREV